jgi:hypothetical protein
MAMYKNAYAFSLKNMVTKIQRYNADLMTWMVSPCIYISVYAFQSGYISPAPSAV